MKSKRFPQIGDYVIVVTAHDSLDPGFLIRATSTADNRCQGEVMFCAESDRIQVGQVVNFRKGMVEPAPREKRAELYESQATILEKKVTEMTEEAESLREQAKHLRAFPSDAEAMADALAAIWSKNIPHVKKMKMLIDVVGAL
jgi:hypothetical protein